MLFDCVIKAKLLGMLKGLSPIRDHGLKINRM